MHTAKGQHWVSQTNDHAFCMCTSCKKLLLPGCSVVMGWLIHHPGNLLLKLTSSDLAPEQEHESSKFFTYWVSKKRATPLRGFIIYLYSWLTGDAEEGGYTARDGWVGGRGTNPADTKLKPDSGESWKCCASLRTKSLQTSHVLFLNSEVNVMGIV